MSRHRSETNAILDQLGRLVRQLSRLTGGVEDSLSLTASQRISLVEIGQDGPLRLNDLAHRIGASAPTASRAVDALEAHGLVTRSPDPDDRRALSIELTPAGRTLFDDRAARARQAFRPAAKALSPEERHELLVLLERMTAALRDSSG